MNACRSCKAPIVWAVTEKGKAIPIDPDPVEGGNIALRTETVDGREVKRACYRKGDSLIAEARYVSHFATCEFADQHRAT